LGTIWATHEESRYGSKKIYGREGYQDTVGSRSFAGTREEGGPKMLCRRCKSQPKDVVHNEYDDTIIIIICDNYYGEGYQKKRDSRVTNNFRTNVDSPDYDDKEKRLEAVVETADTEIFVFYLMLRVLKNSAEYGAETHNMRKIPTEVLSEVRGAIRNE
jgi:hypothetical protein